MTAEKFKSICEYKGITWNDLVRIRIIRPKKFLGFFRKQERSYNNDLVGIFERYKDIADGDMEVAMNFIKEAYPFNEETESFIRKKFDMPMPDESKE